MVICINLSLAIPACWDNESNTFDGRNRNCLPEASKPRISKNREGKPEDIFEESLLLWLLRPQRFCLNIWLLIFEGRSQKGCVVHQSLKLCKRFLWQFLSKNFKNSIWIWLTYYSLKVLLYWAELQIQRLRKMLDARVGLLIIRCYNLCLQTNRKQ